MQAQNNKYTTWYFSLINNARKRSQEKSNGMELHHIIPRSLGGDNRKDNLVYLTYREHFVCHRLLTKMVTGESKYKMAWALMLLSSKRKILFSRHFDTARKILSDASKYREKTTEWRKKMSIRMKGEKNPNFKASKIKDERSPEKRKIDGILKMTNTKREQALNGTLPIQCDLSIKEKIRKKRIGCIQTENQKKIATETNSLWYKVQLPNKEIISVFNLKKFCQENNLDRSNLYCTYTGKIKLHKGYKLLSYIDR